jgi:hypothetical protein
MEIPPNSPSPWTPDRSRLREWLQRNAPSLGELYVGCVEMLYVQSVAGFTRFVAHAIRDIRNRLPDAVAGPKGGLFQWKNRLDRLEQVWVNAGLPLDARPGLVGSPTLSGGDVSVPSGVFRQVQVIVREHRDARERPQQAAERLWEGLGSSAQDRSSIIPVINEWLEVTEWFVVRAHDRGEVDADYPRQDYEKNFGRFERILIALVGGFYPAVEGLDEILVEANS